MSIELLICSQTEVSTDRLGKMLISSQSNIFFLFKIVKKVTLDVFKIKLFRLCSHLQS